jgi:hypothetical protein
MPCDTRIRNETERKRRLKAKEDLEKKIENNEITVVKQFDGSFRITNWTATEAYASGWCEGCVLRSIQQSGSWMAKQKLSQIGITTKPFVAGSHSDHDH